MLSVFLLWALNPPPQTLAVLGPGSVAPPLSFRTWIKGEPIKRLDNEKIYLLEFWATWCGPCHEAIPELTKISRELPSVQVIGVAVLEPNNKGQVQDFVKTMGDKMDYRVAYSGENDRMAKSWLAAAKQTGIPTSFIVSGGKVMWIGHPLRARVQLESLLAGSFDVVASRKKFDEGIARKERIQYVETESKKCDELFRSGKREGAKIRLAQLKAWPEAREEVENLEFLWLASENTEAWKRKCLDRLAESEESRSSLSSFCNRHALRLPSQSRWLIEQVCTIEGPPNWYPLLNAGRVFKQLKEYDLALSYLDKSRKVIEDDRRANPDAPKGNALEVIQDLVDEIKKARMKR